MHNLKKIDLVMLTIFWTIFTCWASTEPAGSVNRKAPSKAAEQRSTSNYNERTERFLKKLRNKRESSTEGSVFGHLKLEEDYPESSTPSLDTSALIESLLTMTQSRQGSGCGTPDNRETPTNDYSKECNNQDVASYYDPRGSWEEGQPTADFTGDDSWNAAMVTCASHDSCLRSDTTVKLLEFTSKLRDSRNCLCDSDCEVYGNCCLDYPLGKISNDTKKTKKWSCTTVNDRQAYFLISTCPNEWENEHVRRQCEENEENSSDRFLKIPVSSRDTLLTYRNVFCAVCNDDFNASFWRTELHCPSYEKFVEVGRNADISNCKIRFTVPKITYREGNESVLEISALPLKSCDAGLVSECPNKWMQHRDFNYALDVATKCALIYAPVNKMNFFGLIKYKNKFCAICNEVKEEELLCPISFAPEAPSGKNALPLLLDMDFTRGGTIVGSQERCPEMQVYDPWRKLCRSVMCASDHVYEQGHCVPASTDDKKVLRSTQDFNESFFTSCARVTFIEQEVEFFENGTALIVSDGTILEPGHYKLDDNSTITVCLPSDLSIYVATFTNVQGWLTMIGICISVAALIIKVVLSLFSKERKKVSSRIVLFLSVSLSSAQLLFILGISRTDYPILCQVIGIAMHFCFLSSFFWMNVLAYDIWKTFASSSSMVKAELATRQLIWYSLYGWLSPAGIVLFSVLANWMPPYPELSPQYGVAVCWFSNKISLAIFFGAPLAVLLLANVTFFVITAVEIRKTTLMAKSATENTKRKDHVRFGLYCKLACIMGLTWLFGFVAAFAGNSILWYFFIILNSIQGVYVLVAFTHFHTPDWMRPAKLIKNRYTSSSRSSLTATSSLPKF